MSGPLPFIAGIRAFANEVPSSSTDLAEWKKALADWGVTLDESGELRRRDVEIGRWMLLGAAAADDALAQCHHDCPWVGPRLGALAFDVFAWTDPNDCHELFCGLLKEGRDGFVHRPTGRAFPAIARQERSLYGAVGKAMLDDGAELLTRELGPYMHDVIETLEQLVGSNDPDGAISWSPTCHNPLRWRGDEPAADFLWKRTAELWLYDFSILDALIELTGARENFFD